MSQGTIPIRNGKETKSQSSDSIPFRDLADLQVRGNQAAAGNTLALQVDSDGKVRYDAIGKELYSLSLENR